MPSTPHGSRAFEPGLDAPHSWYHAHGKFGRLFPNLPRLALKQGDADELIARLLELGKRTGIMNAGTAGPVDPLTPAVYPFLGQFIVHEITFDPTSSFERQTDLEALANFRTPALELDSLYGAGPEVMPYLYHVDDVSAGPFMLFEWAHGRKQIPRVGGKSAAIVADPRNDENLIISQLHLAFILFHNKIVDRLRTRRRTNLVFREAQRIVRWHFQWLVVHDYLPRAVGKDMVDSVLERRRYYDWRTIPFIPVEFSAAIFRFGHSQTPGVLEINDSFGTAGGDRRVPLFDPTQTGDDPRDLRGGIRSADRYVDWRNFVRSEGRTPQFARPITPQLAEPFFRLPGFPDDEPRNPSSLAQRNLLRGDALGLPSGQSVARAMGLAPLRVDELFELGMADRTPLWYYVLHEAAQTGGDAWLGPMAGRILAEVLVGLLHGDRLSYLRADPQWLPEVEDVGTTSSFDVTQLIALVT